MYIISGGRANFPSPLHWVRSNPPLSRSRIFFFNKGLRIIFNRTSMHYQKLVNKWREIVSCFLKMWFLALLGTKKKVPISNTKQLQTRLVLKLTNMYGEQCGNRFLHFHLSYKLTGWLWTTCTSRRPTLLCPDRETLERLMKFNSLRVGRFFHKFCSGAWRFLENKIN